MTPVPDAPDTVSPDRPSRASEPDGAAEVGRPVAAIGLPVTDGPAYRSSRRMVGRRTLAYLGTVLLLVVINFALPRLMPGDPIEAMTAQAGAGGGQATMPDEGMRAALEATYGLDQPVHRQFVDYLGGLATGDLGVSIAERRPVSTLLGERLPWTLLLMGTAIAISTTVGMLVGIHSGWRAGRRGDWRLLTVVTVVRQIPPFFLAAMALVVFAATLGVVPLGGASTPFADDMSLLARVGDVGHHLVLPAGVLAMQLSAATFLFMRGAMAGELGAGYLLLGRAKGVGEGRLKYRYAARNALLPVVSLTALQLAFAVGGSIFVETVFSYPGVGRLIFDAVAARDYPVLQGGFLVLAIAVVTANYLADLGYARLDPRVSR